MKSTDAFGSILSEIRRCATKARDLTSLEEMVVETVARHRPSYNWIGFYMLDPAQRDVLVLGAFRGAPTVHVRIPVTKGICGAAVAGGETIVVDDVSQDPRYLSCSLETRSEIVAPIRANGEIIGEIDVDSHTPGAFGPEDRSFLESCAVVVGRFVELSAGIRR